MSSIKLLTTENLSKLSGCYHSYLSSCKATSSKATNEEFLAYLRSRHDEFQLFTDRQIKNQIIAQRRIEGPTNWPNINDLTGYLSPIAKQFIDKARKSALLAVELYNKPTAEYRTEGYIVMMNIAWTSLFHAILVSKGEPYKHKVKGQEQYYELRKCLEIYNGVLKKEIAANLIFLIELRDVIVHRITVDLDDDVFGECQACLFNFSKVLSTHFGAENRLPNSLAYSLQFNSTYTDQQLVARKSHDLQNDMGIKEFINKYRSNLNPEIFQSPHYSFRVFMIPKVGNHLESSDLAVEFIKYDPDNQDEYASYEKLLYVLKNKRAPGDYFKAGEVAKKITERLRNKMPEGWSFSASYHHSKCVKHFKIRQPASPGEPDKTNEKYCVYDPTFKQYIYTQDWIEHLAVQLSNQNTFDKIMKSA